MTEKHTTQGQTQGDQQTQSAIEEMETESNPAQQLPNTDPTTNGTNNWPDQNWNSIDWGSFGYYKWEIPMMYWENNPGTQEKGKQKGGQHLSGWPRRSTTRKDPAGEAYARRDWALRQMKGQW